MRPEDKSDFALALTACVAAYREEADEALAEGYWITLSDLPLEKVSEAIVELMRTSKFMPRASEIRGLVVEKSEAIQREQRRQIEQAQQHSAGLAFYIVRKGLKAGASEERIRQVLAKVGEEQRIKLYWPGEAPWEKPVYPMPGQLPELDFSDEAAAPRLELQRP